MDMRQQRGRCELREKWQIAQETGSVAASLPRGNDVSLAGPAAAHSPAEDAASRAIAERDARIAARVAEIEAEQAARALNRSHDRGRGREMTR